MRKRKSGTHFSKQSPEIGQTSTCHSGSQCSARTSKSTAFQILISPSKEPLAMRLPSGENNTEVTPSECPTSVQTCLVPAIKPCTPKLLFFAVWSHARYLLWCACHIPDLDRVVVGTTRKIHAIRRECDGSHPVFMPRKCVYLLFRNTLSLSARTILPEQNTRQRDTF